VQIATAGDANEAANALQLSLSSDGVNFSNTATVNGVTVTLTDGNGAAAGNNPNAQGAVFAQIAAACGATNASFTLRVIDSGNLAATTLLAVTVTVKTTAPVIQCNNVAAQTASANANCQAAVPDVTALVRAQSSDNCTTQANLIITQSPLAGTLVGLGSNPITVTVKDAANNMQTCNVAFTFNDTTMPVITCNNVAAQTANADANCLAVVPDVRALVRAQSSDICTTNAALTVTQSPLQGSTVSGAGSHSITVTVTDAANNSQSCVVALTVNDVILPTITCPGNQVGVTYNSAPNNSVPVSWTTQVNDNCAGGSSFCTPASGSPFPVGTTTVNCKAIDAAGNQSTACSFTVTVRQPRSAVRDLITKVKALAPGTLTTAQANQLVGHLELANSNLERGQTAAACTNLQNFINQVNALTSPLSQTQAQDLLSYAHKIRVAVGCVSSARADTVALVNHSNSQFQALVNHTDSQFTQAEQWAGAQTEWLAQYGQPGDVPIAGDWDGDGVDTFGVYRAGVFYLSNTMAAPAAEPVWLAQPGDKLEARLSKRAELVIAFGQAGDVPVVGDWDGDGRTTIGVFRAGQFLLRYTNTPGEPDVIINCGAAGDVPLAGDWDGDEQATIGVYTPAMGLFRLRNALADEATADILMLWGGPDYQPVSGDWDGDGVTTIGLYSRSGEFLLRNTHTAGAPDYRFILGLGEGAPLAGCWGQLP
jgi:hypothetical protein